MCELTTFLHTLSSLRAVVECTTRPTCLSIMSMSVYGCVCSVSALSSGICRQSLRVLKLNYCKQISNDSLRQLAANCRRSVTFTFTFTFTLSGRV